MRNKLAKVAGVLVGAGFAVPSIYGFLQPVDSAKNWKLVLAEQASVDQYRTLSLLILALGALIIFGALHTAYVRISLLACLTLLAALIFGRLLSLAIGEPAALLLIELIVEALAAVVVVLALRAIS